MAGIKGRFFPEPSPHYLLRGGEVRYAHAYLSQTGVPAKRMWQYRDKMLLPLHLRQDMAMDTIHMPVWAQWFQILPSGTPRSFLLDMST